MSHRSWWGNSGLRAHHGQEKVWMNFDVVLFMLFCNPCPPLLRELKPFGHLVAQFFEWVPQSPEVMQAKAIPDEMVTSANLVRCASLYLSPDQNITRNVPIGMMLGWGPESKIAFSRIYVIPIVIGRMFGLSGGFCLLLKNDCTKGDCRGDVKAFSPKMRATQVSAFNDGCRTNRMWV